VIFVAAALMLATTAVVASLVPARQAASVDPTQALRTEWPSQKALWTRRTRRTWRTWRTRI